VLRSISRQDAQIVLYNNLYKFPETNGYEFFVAVTHVMLTAMQDEMLLQGEVTN
jgi:hypothetical protein